MGRGMHRIRTPSPIDRQVPRLSTVIYSRPVVGCGGATYRPHAHAHARSCRAWRWANAWLWSEADGCPPGLDGSSLSPPVGTFTGPRPGCPLCIRIPVDGLALPVPLQTQPALLPPGRPDETRRSGGKPKARAASTCDESLALVLI